MNWYLVEIERCDIKVGDGSFESEESSTALVMWHIFLTDLFRLKIICKIYNFLSFAGEETYKYQSSDQILLSNLTKIPCGVYL